MELPSHILSKIVHLSFGDYLYRYVYAPDFHPLWSDPETRFKLRNISKIRRSRLRCQKCTKIKLDHVFPLCENCVGDSDIVVSYRPAGMYEFQILNLRRTNVTEKKTLYDIWSVIYKKPKRTKEFDFIKYIVTE